MAGARQQADVDDEMTSAPLRIALPEFWFGRLTHRREPARWVAASKDDTSRGLYMIAAADPDALTAALLSDQEWRSAHCAPGAQPESRRRDSALGTAGRAIKNHPEHPVTV